jgi:hypothetical protein
MVWLVIYAFDFCWKSFQFFNTHSRVRVKQHFKNETERFIFKQFFVCPVGHALVECGKPPTFDSLYIQMDIVSACTFGYTFPAALFFTVHAYMSIKKCIVEYLYEDS